MNIMKMTTKENRNQFIEIFTGKLDNLEKEYPNEKILIGAAKYDIKRISRMRDRDNLLVIHGTWKPEFSDKEVIHRIFSVMNLAISERMGK